MCAWAEAGAAALGPDGVLVQSESFPPESLVDTLGAGDTFNAAVIYTLANGRSRSLSLALSLSDPCCDPCCDPDAEACGPQERVCRRL